MPEHHEKFELSIREAFESGRMDAAARATLEAYGCEIRGFLHARLKSRSEALEAFSMFTEHLWTGLPRFRWRCSMRTWSYTLARNAAVRQANSIRRHTRYHLPLADSDWLPQSLQPAHDDSPAYLEGAVEEGFQRLRQQLDSQEQKLLALRVDNKLAWKALTVIMLARPDASEDEVARESARLRKVFERIKVELRRLAERDGLPVRPRPGGASRRSSVKNVA